MSKAKKHSLTGSDQQPVKSEYDDQETDVVKGEKIKVKSERAAGGGGTHANGSKAQSFFKGGKAYVHPPDRLIKGRVIYPVKYLGHLKVTEPRGKKLVKDTIDMVKVAAEVRQANNPGWQLTEVDLSISIRSVICLKRGSKDVLHQHPIHVVSFSADDKRGDSNMFAYIVKPKPPAVDHICYVYECTEGQAVELTATIGEAFELAYQKFLEAKRAQEQLMKLKERLQTASPEEKEEIRKQLETIETEKILKLVKRREAAERKAKLEEERIAKEAEAERAAHAREVLVNLKVEGPPKYYVEEPHDDLHHDPEVSKQLAEIEKEAEAIEVNSELERQGKLKHSTSVAEKWETVTGALQPLQSTQKQLQRFQVNELDDVIAGLEGEIADLEEAFNWVPGKRKVAPYDATDYVDPDLDKKMSEIEEQFKSVQVAGEDLEVPELPANYVMDEFLKAREKASLPKQGSVLKAAGTWYKEHHD